MDAEFSAFCKKDGLSPSSTHYQLWKAARPLGLLPAIWAVLHSEVPQGDKLDELLGLEPYAVSPLEPVYLAPVEAAEQLNVTTEWIRQLMRRDELAYKETPLGRLISQESLDSYRARHSA